MKAFNIFLMARQQELLQTETKAVERWSSAPAAGGQVLTATLRRNLTMLQKTVSNNIHKIASTSDHRDDGDIFMDCMKEHKKNEGLQKRKLERMKQRQSKLDLLHTEFQKMEQERDTRCLEHNHSLLTPKSSVGSEKLEHKAITRVLDQDNNLLSPRGSQRSAVRGGGLHYRRTLSHDMRTGKSVKYRLPPPSDNSEASEGSEAGGSLNSSSRASVESGESKNKVTLLEPYCTVLYCTVLYCTGLYWTVL